MTRRRAHGRWRMRGRERKCSRARWPGKQGSMVGGEVGEVVEAGGATRVAGGRPLLLLGRADGRDGVFVARRGTKKASLQVGEEGAGAVADDKNSITVHKIRCYPTTPLSFSFSVINLMGACWYPIPATRHTNKAAKPVGDACLSHI